MKVRKTILPGLCRDLMDVGYHDSVSAIRSCASTRLNGKSLGGLHCSVNSANVQ